VLLGGNDFLRKVPRDTTYANLKMIISNIQEKGSAVLLLGVRGGLLSDNADEMYEDLARETKSAYVPDVLDGLFGDSRFMSDSIHPNNEGYKRMAERIYPILSNLLNS
jgi:lysophospholipase L1-like esterase